MNNDAVKIGVQQAALSLLRIVLMLIGASLVAKGWLPSTEVLNEIVGYLLIIAPSAWSLVDRFLSEHRTQVREQTALEVGAIAGPAASLEDTQVKIKTFTANQGDHP